jgi:Flp pilus assembly protein TadG
MRRRHQDERGITTIQVAILFPVILFWLLLIVQYGLWWHAKQVANAAAAEAVDAAQISTGTSRDGEHAAASYLSQSGNLSNVVITVAREPASVTAEVHGDAPRLVPGFEWSVTARRTAPVERFIPAPER